MRALSSFTLSIILCIVLSIGIIVSFTVEHFSVIVADNIAKITGMERTTDFESLEKKLNDINAEADINRLQVFTKNQAIDVIIKYADYLLTVYNARAETDYPEDVDNVLKLRIKFATKFDSAQAFLNTMGTMLKLKSPIVQINEVAFNIERQLDPRIFIYTIDVDAYIIQPYIPGDGNNGK